jgi:energy-converting hydrogenase Eha subunit E
MPSEPGDRDVIEQSVELQKTGTDPVDTTEFVKAVSEPLKFISVLGVVAGIVFALFGVWLAVAGGASGDSTVKFLGQEIKTTNVGVACVFIGAAVAIGTIRRVLKSFDIVIGRKRR